MKNVNAKIQSRRFFKPFSTLMLAAVFSIAPFSSYALSAEEIAKRVDARDDGDKGSAKIQMVLIDRQGNKRERIMQKFEKDDGDDTHSVIFFLEPSDVRNTAFLTYDYADSSKDDDQWLYLPALRNTKRIVSSDKSSSFMGSDFSYADMTSRALEDYHYKIAKEDDVNGHKVWIMETVPKTEKIRQETGYDKSYMFVRQDNYVVVRAIHFQTDGKRKYMDVKKLEKIQGIWVPTLIEMRTTKDKVTLHTTLMYFNDVKFNQDLDDSFFTVRRIERGL